jgi:hypothetical protein
VISPTLRNLTNAWRVDLPRPTNAGSETLRHPCWRRTIADKVNYARASAARSRQLRTVPIRHLCVPRHAVRSAYQSYGWVTFT